MSLNSTIPDFDIILKTPIAFREESMTIWVNEQIDPSGMIYACIATRSESHAKDCHESFQQNLTELQKATGWVAQLRTVNSWDDVPVNALKLN